MLDVHAPHTRLTGFKDFLLHLLTITIGLLIALGLEGCVEWQHHRYLVHEANDALSHEITQNLKTLESFRQPIQEQRKELSTDLTTLAEMRAHPTTQGQTLGFGFTMHSFDNVAWKTAQATGAVTYMSYGDASQYADIYSAQERLVETEQQVVDEVLRSASLPSSRPKDWRPTPAQIDDLTDRVGLLRMRLDLLSSMLDSLEKAYKKFGSAHA